MIILGGDLNARTANKGGWIDAEWVERRISKDKKINKEGKELIRKLEENGLSILNGERGQEDGECTYVGEVGASVIDYLITNIEARNIIDEMIIEDRTESDHLPIILKLRIKNMQEKKRKKKSIIVWTEETKENYEKIISKTEIISTWEDLR